MRLREYLQLAFERMREGWSPIGQLWLCVDEGALTHSAPQVGLRAGLKLERDWGLCDSDLWYSHP